MRTHGTREGNYGLLMDHNCPFIWFSNQISSLLFVFCESRLYVSLYTTLFCTQPHDGLLTFDINITPTVTIRVGVLGVIRRRPAGWVLVIELQP